MWWFAHLGRWNHYRVVLRDASSSFGGFSSSSPRRGAVKIVITPDLRNTRIAPNQLVAASQSSTALRSNYWVCDATRQSRDPSGLQLYEPVGIIRTVICLLAFFSLRFPPFPSGGEPEGKLIESERCCNRRKKALHIGCRKLIRVFALRRLIKDCKPFFIVLRARVRLGEERAVISKCAISGLRE